MILGVVTANHEPTVPLRVRGPSGVESDIEFVVDTGFTGAVVLPVTVVTALGLNWWSGRTVLLADGSTQRVNCFEADLLWGSNWVRVIATSVGPEALIGMHMLYGHRLTVEGGPGGQVEIVPWP